MLAGVLLALLFGAVLNAVRDIRNRIDLGRSIDDQLARRLDYPFTEIIQDLRGECKRTIRKSNGLPAGVQGAALDSVERYYISFIEELYRMNRQATIRALETNQLSVANPFGPCSELKPLSDYGVVPPKLRKTS
ncbi:TPA: hypothetical protein DIV48_03365 [Candidatus Kaiserbacteria bacterium]|nr:hypothetical protein [Candidatus Kaiserbacteria bacterium]